MNYMDFYMLKFYLMTVVKLKDKYFEEYLSKEQLAEIVSKLAVKVDFLL